MVGGVALGLSLIIPALISFVGIGAILAGVIIYMEYFDKLNQQSDFKTYVDTMVWIGSYAAVFSFGWSA